MKEYRYYREAIDIQLDKECTRIIQDIREEAKKYSTDYIYNIDKTSKY